MLVNFTDIGIYACVIIGSYLVGSISPSIFISKLKGKDIMKEGSGNAGATNAVRVLGWKFGLCVFLLDFLKGFITSLLIILFMGSFTGYLAGVSVILGHVYSVFHKFKAGKGVAPSIGVMFAVDWKVALIVLALGLLLVLITRRVSVGSISAAIALPFLTCFFCNDFLAFAIIIAVLIVFNHRANIKRLFKGEEKKLF